MREGLRQVLKGLDGLNAPIEVLDASTCAQAFELADQHADLDLVLLDYHLPHMNGLDALNVFGKRHPELPIIMISGLADSRVVRQVITRGAAGFVSKAGHADELLAVIRTVMAGEIHVPHDLLDAPERAAAPSAGSGQAPLALTPRQVEVLYLLLDGFSNKDISRSLQLSEETAKTHVSAIYRAFGVQTRVQAVLSAARHGYTRATPVV